MITIKSTVKISAPGERYDGKIGVVRVHRKSLHEPDLFCVAVDPFTTAGGIEGAAVWLKREQLREVRPVVRFEEMDDT